MPDLQTFAALRFNPLLVHAKDVVAPPYDVISEVEHAALLAKSSYNIVRVELPSEVTGKDKYENAGEVMRSWITDGVLQRDGEDGFYLYDQEFTNAGGERVTRSGFFALCRLEEFSRGNILPHEKTLSGPKADRLKLMHAVRANVSPIFSLYHDPQHIVWKLLEHSAGHAQVDFLDKQNERHVVRIATGGRVMDDVREAMLHRTAYIADGHHRYETALKFRDEMWAQHPDASPDAPWNFILMYFAAMEGDGMEIQPTHRLVHSLASFERCAFETALQENFTLTQCATLDEGLRRLGPAGSDGLLFAYPAANECTLAVMKMDVDRGKAFGDDVPSVLHHVSVAMLHRLVFRNILHMSDEAQLRKENLDYVHTVDAVREALASGSTQCAVLMNPTTMEQLRKSAEAGVPLPQKSTYFYPKLITGLVMSAF